MDHPLLTRTTTVLITIYLLKVFYLTCCQDTINTQEVHDVNFNFRRSCRSMIINWTTPTYQDDVSVSRYIVQSAQNCPAMWKDQAVFNGTVHSMVIDDLALVTACLQGMCHIRISADLEYSSGQTMRTFSHCVRISSSFYNYSLETVEYVHYIGQQVCLLIRTACPTLPTFYIGEERIALTGTEGIDDDHYVNRTTNQLCIRNNSDENLVVHEVCHIDTKCPLCHEDTGELVLMTRTEVQTISSVNISEPDNTIMMTMLPDVNSVPSIVIICSGGNYTMSDDNWVEVCLCMPLHQIQGHHNSDGIVMIELNFQHDNSTVPGTTMNVHTNMSRQCFNVEVPVTDIQYNGTSLEMCLKLPGSTDATRCVHVPGSCVEITVSEEDKTTVTTHDNTTLGSTTTTSSDIDESRNGEVIVAIVIPLTLVIIGLLSAILMILIISCIFWKKYCNHEETLTKETKQQSPGPEENTDNINLSDESVTEV